jgi:tRNA-dihydrouridine synthase C
MLMIGRGAVADPGLGLAIKADMARERAAGEIVPTDLNHAGQVSGATAIDGITWPLLMPLVLDFWHLVCTRLDARSRAGRLKQWLNFLRRRFPEAEQAYQSLKSVNDPALVDEWLAAHMQGVTHGVTRLVR